MIEYAVGFLSALLAGLGVGGGGLLVIYLVLIENIEQLRAQGINLVFFLFSSAASLTVHVKKRNIPYRLTAVLAFAGVAGAVIGNILVNSVSEELARMMFGVFLIISGAIAVFR